MQQCPLEREKLRQLHVILSKIGHENSQTMSHFHADSTMEVNAFRSRYLENCDSLSNAHAIAALYYPEMTTLIQSIAGQANLFWGNQEGMLRTDIDKNREVWMSYHAKVLDAGAAITKYVNQLHSMIENRGAELKKMILHDAVN